MDVPVRLIDLPEMHPELLWETILTATAAVLGEPSAEPPYPFTLAVENVPGFGTEECRLLIDTTGVAAGRMAQVRRTYESSRLVELAASPSPDWPCTVPAATRSSTSPSVAARPITWWARPATTWRSRVGGAGLTWRPLGGRSGNGFPSARGPDFSLCGRVRGANGPVGVRAVTGATTHVHGTVGCQRHGGDGQVA